MSGDCRGSRFCRWTRKCSLRRLATCSIQSGSGRTNLSCRYYGSSSLPIDLPGHLVANQVNAKVDPYEGVLPSRAFVDVRNLSETWASPRDSCGDRFWRAPSIGSVAQASDIAGYVQASAITACCFNGRARAFVRFTRFLWKHLAAVVVERHRTRSTRAFSKRRSVAAFAEPALAARSQSRIRGRFTEKGG